ncbi:MAG: S1C family serine protease, partial [Acidobacteriota bacterium]|nr:S1C family serine protease [Acidobacteriota bacterium]
MSEHLGHISRRKLTRLIGCLILFGLSAAPRAKAQTPTAQTGAGGCAAESVPAIYQRVSPSVVFISAISINPYKVNDRVEHVVGSGFIVDPKGYILTNQHVIEGATRITVKLQSGETLRARVVGTDEETDLAVLKVEAGRDLPSVRLGDSNQAE